MQLRKPFPFPGRNRQRLHAAFCQFNMRAILGPDRSEVVLEYPDGWSVRHVKRLADQRREGILGHHCLRRMVVAEGPVFSLRDDLNLPHATFTGWRLRGTPFEGRMREHAHLIPSLRFDKRTVLDVYLVDLGGPKHVRRLRDFAREHAHMLPLLPAERREAVRTFQRPHWVGEALYRSERPSDRRYLALLREVERRMALEVTTGRSTVFEVALQRLAVTEMAPSASTLGRGRPRVVIATYQPAEPAAGQTA